MKLAQINVSHCKIEGRREFLDAKEPLPFEDILARVMRPGALHRGLEILGEIDGLMDYAGEEIYNKHRMTKILLMLNVRGLRWLDRQIRKAERRESAEVTRSHAQAARIAKENGLVRSQLEASLPGEPAMLRWKRQNRLARNPSENDPSLSPAG